jgi:hypothetical protein
MVKIVLVFELCESSLKVNPREGTREAPID